MAPIEPTVDRNTLLARIAEERHARGHSFAEVEHHVFRRNKEFLNPLSEDEIRRTILAKYVRRSLTSEERARLLQGCAAWQQFFTAALTGCAAREHVSGTNRTQAASDRVNEAAIMADFGVVLLAKYKEQAEATIVQERTHGQ